MKTGEKEKIEIVPSSVRSVSSNIAVSKNREWLFYNFGEIYRVLHQIDVVLKEKPKYLLTDELSFLEQYKSEFTKNKIHNQFKLATHDYIHLLTKALTALDTRMKAEESSILDAKDETKFKGQIVAAFAQLSSLLRDINNTFFKDLKIIQSDPQKYIKVIKYLNRGVEYLLRTYVYEYILFSNPKDLSFDELIELNSAIDQLYVDFNREDFASPVFQLGSEIYEIYS